MILLNKIIDMKSTWHHMGGFFISGVQWTEVLYASLQINFTRYYYCKCKNENLVFQDNDIN